MRTTKEDMENASEKGEQECWFGEGGCHQSSEIESGSWKDCCYSGVNLATSIYGDKPRSKWDDDDDIKNIRDLSYFNIQCTVLYVHV